MGEVHESASDIDSFLKENPEATVGDIAKAHDLEADDVIVIIDSHLVDEDGNIDNIGPGQGGGWHPAVLAEEARKEQQRAAIDAMIEEREQILSDLPSEADSYSMVEESIEELKKAREELE